MSGHLEQRGGRWRVTVDVGVDPLTGRRRRVSRTLAKGATKRDALDLAAELRLAARAGPPATKSLTVGELLDAWLEHVAADLSPTTIQGYRKNVERYLRPAFGTLPARKLTPARIDTLYRRMRLAGVTGRPLSPATIRRTHATLTSACGQAVKWEWLPSNPCDRATVPRAIRSDVEAPDLADIERVLEVAGADLVDAVGLALATGARRGELAGLQWADVDLEVGEVTFRRSVGDVAGVAVVIEDRRKSATRTVTIDGPTVEMLRARRARAAEAALACGVTLAAGAHVLADEPGQVEPIRPQLISHRWRLAAKRAGVAVRFHDLRHWHVTELMLAGIPTPQVVARAGWASPQMLRVYAHARQELDRQASDVIARRRAE